MIFRKIMLEDVDKLREIHQRYFADEFDFSYFVTHMLEGFCIVDKKDQIITAAAIRPIAEITMITNKGFTPRQRKEAFDILLDPLCNSSQKFGFQQSHIFVQDESWEKVLKKHYKFRDCVGNALVIDN